VPWGLSNFHRACPVLLHCGISSCDGNNASLGRQVYDEENGGEDEHQDNNPTNQETDETTVAD
jgi:hypothetical protein